MRVGVDMHVLDGINQGSKTYLSKIYSNKNISDSNVEHVFYMNSSGRSFLEWSKFSRVSHLPSSKISRLTIGAGIAAKKDGIDVFHSQYIIPFYMPALNIVTIHDILFENYPQYFSSSFVARSKVLVRLSAARADRIITVSEFSKKSLIEIYGVSEKKIGIVPNGVNLEDFSIDLEVAKSTVIHKYGVSDYFLTVGRLEPRKNHKRLLLAYSELLKRKIDLPKLVVVGQCDFGFSEFFDLVKVLGLTNYVLHIADANFADLVVLYRAASLFLYPSYAEGFGIPPLEAMASGVPVICSSNTSMKELYSKASIQVDPDDTSQLVEAILAVQTNANVRDDIIRGGYSLAESLNWNNSAKLMLKEYHEI